jgi:hypothetical protein
MPKKPTSAVDEAFDELYSIEPSAFVARRNALAAERKAAGRRSRRGGDQGRAEAQRIGGHREPAWSGPSLRSSTS